MSKLVAYFSYSGVTKKKAENLAKENSADTFEIKAKVPYTNADVNWQNKCSRNVIEYNDKSSRPEIESMPDLSSIDEIWIGSPVYYGGSNGRLTSFLDRFMFSTLKSKLTGKLAASVVTCRRGGAIATFERLNMYFTMLNIKE